MEKHDIEAFYKSDSKVLILGSFPSVKSREEGFYYAHPQNRFWKILGKIFHEEIGVSVNDKKEFLKQHQIALFDMCATCNIKGSSDLSIKDVKPNNILKIINNSSIEAIFLNGKTAAKFYNKFYKGINIPVFVLSSTSPANARYQLNELIDAYKIILTFLDCL